MNSSLFTRAEVRYIAKRDSAKSFSWQRANVWVRERYVKVVLPREEETEFLCGDGEIFDDRTPSGTYKYQYAFRKDDP